MMCFTPRLLNGLGFVVVVLLMAAAYYMQYVMGLEPCAMCMLQRFILVMVGLVLMVATIQNPASRGVGIYAIVTMVLSLAGLASAGRHVWLQHLPADQVPECAPPWDYLIDSFPLTDVIRTMLKGSGDCAVVTWRMLGMSIPEWMLLVFAGFTVLGVLQIVRRRTS